MKTRKREKKKNVRKLMEKISLCDDEMNAAASAAG